ncbi:MAG: hemolysin family protein [Bacteroidetes bacterium]|nr:hemolysin family protein [Bacteroidota bacterium]
MVLEIIILFFLFLINGLFVMTEIALVSSRKTRLELDAQSGHKGARAALEQANKPARILSTFQIAITLIGILTGVFSGAEISSGFAQILISVGVSQSIARSLALTIVVIVVTLVSMLIGELVPKRIGLINPEGISKVMIRPIVALSYILKPVTWLLTRLSDGILRFLGIKTSADSKVTEEEIRAMVQEGTDDGEVQEIEQDIVERVFHLGDQRIASLMTHYSDITWLDVNEPPSEMWKKMREEVHSVYPVCRDDLDNLLGVVFIKDLFLRTNCDAVLDLEDFIQPAQLVLETLTAYESLELFKEHKIHYGLVVDEYGSIVGMVTLNDILEAIVGDFNEPDPDEPQINQRDDGSWLADGQMSFYEFAYEFNLQGFDKTRVKFNTLAGLAISILKHIPKPGEKFSFMGFEFEIVDLDGNRIDKLIIKKVAKD